MIEVIEILWVGRIMKKILFVIVIFLMLPLNLSAKEINLELFYGNECPHCHHELEYLKMLEKQFGDNLKVKKYEVWHNKENAKLLADVRLKLKDSDSQGVPYTVTNDKHFLGYSDKIGLAIKKDVTTQIKKNKVINFHGVNINASSANMSLTAILLGMMDSINPCTLLILFFALSISFFIKNKNKFCLIFTLTLSVFYGILIFNDVNYSLNILTVIRTVIAIILIICGGLMLDHFMRSDKSYLQIINKKFLKFKMPFYILLAIIMGMMLISISMTNPFLFKLALGIKGVSFMGKVLNLVIYVLSFFACILLILFLGINIVKKLNNKFSLNNKLHLISGVFIIIIAFLLIYVPELFGFIS